MLRGVYGYQPGDVVRALRAFGGLPTVTIEDAALVAEALDHAEQGMGFADALHLGKSMHCEGFATYDRKLVKAAQAAGHTKVRECQSDSIGSDSTLTHMFRFPEPPLPSSTLEITLFQKRLEIIVEKHGLGFSSNSFFATNSTLTASGIGQ